MTQKKYSQKNKLIQLFNQSKKDALFFDSFDNLINKHGKLILFSVIGLIIFFVFKDFLLLNKIYLFKDIGSDSINITYPAYYSLADYIIKEGFPKWSFNQGMGQNIFPVGYINPFSLYIILMGKNYVYYTIFYAEMFKIFCAGLFFYLFLRKIITSNYLAVVGGVLYSFSGFMILGGQWNYFSTQAVYIALLLYSFEKLYQDDNWILFPISLFLIAAYQPVDLYFIGVFLVLYIIFRLIETNEREPRKLFVFLTKVVFLGTMAVAVSSFFIVNGLQIMLESPRVGGDASYYNTLFSKSLWGLEGAKHGETHYLTALMRFFSCDILGTGSQFRGWYNYLEAPLFYCGLISLIAFPHFLSLQEKRKKIIYFVLIFLFALTIIFPFFRYSYWLFIGDYYRVFSLFVAIVLLLIGLKSIENIDYNSKASITITGATLLLLLICLYYPYRNAQIIDKHVRDTVAIFLIIYSVLVYLIRLKKIRNIVKFLLLSVIIVELIYFSNITVNNRPVISGVETVQKVGYNDYTVDAIQFIKTYDKTFFRINKDYYSGTGMYNSMNDSLAQEFYGTPSYYSFNQLNYIKFLQELGIIKRKAEEQTRWSPGLVNCPFLHGFASIKYALTKDKKYFLMEFGYEPITRLGNVTVLRNKFYLPLGFTYEKFILLKDFKILSQTQKVSALYKAVVVDEHDYSHLGNLAKLDLSGIQPEYSVKEYSDDVKLLNKNVLYISKHGQNEIRGRINADKDKLLFFSIPYDKGWNIKVDGKNVNAMKVNVGFIGVPIAEGLHDIELSFTPSYFYSSAAVSLIAFLLFVFLIVFKYLRYGKKH